jgi:hypothetical protein
VGGWTTSAAGWAINPPVNTAASAHNPAVFTLPPHEVLILPYANCADCPTVRRNLQKKMQGFAPAALLRFHDSGLQHYTE